jgi:hypothetical protein
MSTSIKQEQPSICANKEINTPQSTTEDFTVKFSLVLSDFWAHLGPFHGNGLFHPRSIVWVARDEGGLPLLTVVHHTTWWHDGGGHSTGILLASLLLATLAHTQMNRSIGQWRLHLIQLHSSYSGSNDKSVVVFLTPFSARTVTVPFVSHGLSVEIFHPVT